MFADGLINMQLPFILISSGISAGLYLLFLFFNIGQPTIETQHIDQQKEFSIELAEQFSDQTVNTNLIHYFNTAYIVAENDNDLSSVESEADKPLKFRSFKFAYSFQFAQASYNRPPPSC